VEKKEAYRWGRDMLKTHSWLAVGLGSKLDFDCILSRRRLAGFLIGADNCPCAGIWGNLPFPSQNSITQRTFSSNKTWCRTEKVRATLVQMHEEEQNRAHLLSFPLILQGGPSGISPEPLIPHGTE